MPCMLRVLGRILLTLSPEGVGGMHCPLRVGVTNNRLWVHYSEKINPGADQRDDVDEELDSCEETHGNLH